MCRVLAVPLQGEHEAEIRVFQPQNCFAIGNSPVNARADGEYPGNAGANESSPRADANVNAARRAGRLDRARAYNDRRDCVGARVPALRGDVDVRDAQSSVAKRRGP